MTPSRFAAGRVNRLIASLSLQQHHHHHHHREVVLHVPPAAAAVTRLVTYVSGDGRTADPAVHANNPEETNDAASSTYNQSAPKPATTKEDDQHPYVPPKSPGYPSSSSPQIHSTGVNHPQQPINQQKRHGSSSSCSPTPAPAGVTSAGEVNCAGLDGSPWPLEEDEIEGSEEDKEYFKHHKASPLSELEMADTRKPISRATDHGTSADTTSYYGGGGGSGAMVWRPEQMDTAEDSLHRALEIWKRNAMRGDPDSPHGRVLRALRGEYW